MSNVDMKRIPGSFWDKLQYVGLAAAGVPAKLGNLHFGGKYSFQVDGAPYTGQVILRVHQGGLRDRTLPVDTKELFRLEIMPVLGTVLPGVDKNYIGKIELHFNEGVMTKFNLLH